MQEQVSNAIHFHGQFIASKIGKTGLTVSIDIWKIKPDGTTTSIVTGGSCSETGRGLYRYRLVAASTADEADYLASMYTADTTVDQREIPAFWSIGHAGVEHLNADVDSRLAPTTAGRTLDVSATGGAGIDLTNVEAPTTVLNLSGTTIKTATDIAAQVTALPTPPTVGAIADQVWDELLSGHAVSGSTGEALSVAGGEAVDPFLNATDDEDYTAGTMGELFIRKLGLVGTASGTVTSPMADDGSYDFTITRGDAYYAGGPAGREAIAWTNTADMWGDYVGKTAVFNAESGDQAIGPKTVVFTLTSPTLVTATMPLTSSDTSAIANTYLGSFLFDVQVTMSTGVFDTPISGTMTLLRDVT